MPRAVLNIVLLSTVIVVLALHWALPRDSAVPNYRLFNDMMDSVAYDSQAANSNFADGKTLQAPAPGTIARGSMPIHYQATPEDAERAGRELPPNPYAADDEQAVQRGASVYKSFCLPCHGASGKGDGAVSSRGFPPPASLLTKDAMNLPDGRIYHVLSYGQTNMPSYASQIPPEDRWKVIAYVRSLQKSSINDQTAQPSNGEPATPDDEKAGPSTSSEQPIPPQRAAEITD